MIKVGIVGGTGYTGADLIRLLSAHPQTELTVITSRKEAGQAVANIFPHLRNISHLKFSEPDTEQLKRCDVVFYATPHGVCMKEAPELLNAGVKVIDLSADFRIKDADEFERWYGIKHSAPDLLKEAVYGLPEIHREALKKARLVAGAGCYPTAVQLGFLPLLKNKLVENQLIADVKSGVSGAGREAKVANLYAEVSENFRAYGVTGHRHQPEIAQGLSALAGEKIDLIFVPHLVPMIRGIEATLYANLKETVDLQALFEETYRHERFVSVLPAGVLPDTRSVRGTNQVLISVNLAPNGKTAIISVTEDNLIKGASGQALQCLNLLFDLPEEMGLNFLAL